MKKRANYLSSTVMAWLVWGIAVLYYLYEYIQRITPSVMVAKIMSSFHIDTISMGNLSAVYFWVYGLMQIPVGVIVDNYGPKRPLLFAAVFITIGSFGFSLSQHLYLSYISRGLIGLGSAFGYLCCLKISVNWFSTRRFAFMCSLINMIGMFGAFIGEVTMSYLMKTDSWRGIIFYMSYIGIALIILLWVFVQDFPPNNSSLTKKKVFEKPKHIWKDLLIILCSKQVILSAIYVSFLYCTFDTIAALWGVSFIHNTYNLNHTMSAQISSLIFLGAIIGYPAFGLLTSYLKARHKLIMIITSIIMLIIGFAIWSAPKNIAVIITLFFFLGFFAGATATATTLAKESMPLAVSGLTMSIVNTALVFIGAASQPLFGYLLEAHQHLGTTHLNSLTATDFYRAFLIMPALYIGSLICALFIKQTSGQAVGET
jgi:MFS family permease